MNKGQIRSAADALDYLADCTLATVCKLAQKKSRSNAEFQRQIAIAQVALDCMRLYGITATGRAAKVNNECSGFVWIWAQQYDAKLEKKGIA